MKGNKDNHAPSVVLVYGTPFEVQIPLSVDGEWKPPTERWFCWPNEVLEQENVLDWIMKPPNFKVMPAEELSAVKADLIGVANSIRSLRVNLLTATKEAEGLRKLADSISSHIYKSANDILRMSAALTTGQIFSAQLRKYGTSCEDCGRL